MPSRALGALLALVAAGLFAVSIATAAWWAGHPVIDGHTTEAKDIHIGLFTATGCNSGGDGACQALPLGATTIALSRAELGVAGLAAMLTAVLGISGWRSGRRRKLAAKLAIAAVALAAAGAAALVVVGPDALSAGHIVKVPIGYGMLVFWGGIAASAVGAVLVLTAAPEPLRPRPPATASPPPAKQPRPAKSKPTKPPPAPPPKLPEFDVREFLGEQAEPVRSSLPPSPGGPLPGPIGPLSPGGAAPSLRPLLETVPMPAPPLLPVLAQLEQGLSMTSEATLEVATKAGTGPVTRAEATPQPPLPPSRPVSEVGLREHDFGVTAVEILARVKREATEVETSGDEDLAETRARDKQATDEQATTAAPPLRPSGEQTRRVPMSTAPASLPPPKDTSAAGPTPACPQCESPMAWVEEHLRFYCKQCRMYF